MGEIVAAYQPHYYPRLHYLARAQQADVFVIYDDVEFSRRSRHHRARFEHYGKEWLTVPVQHTGVHTRLDEARIDMSRPWPVAHLKTLVGTYGKAAEALAPYYERLCATVADIDYLREYPVAVATGGTSSQSGLRAECLRWDGERRALKREFDRIRARKDHIANRIAERRRTNPSATIDDLLAEIEAIEGRLADAEAAYRAAKRRRDDALVTLSASLDAASVERMPIGQLWELDGVDPAELMTDVRLVDLTVPLLEALFRRFEVTSTIVRSSELAVEHPGDASEYLAAMTAHLGGDCYLSGGTGYDSYLDQAPFDARGLDVVVQDWTPPWDGGNVCALDVLFDADDPARYIR